MQDENFYAGCVAGAISRKDYLGAMETAGFPQPQVLSEDVYDEQTLAAFTHGCVGESVDLFQKHRQDIVGKISSAKIKAVKA